MERLAGTDRTARAWSSILLEPSIENEELCVAAVRELSRLQTADATKALHQASETHRSENIRREAAAALK